MCVYIYIYIIWIQLQVPSPCWWQHVVTHSYHPHWQWRIPLTRSHHTMRVWWECGAFDSLLLARLLQLHQSAEELQPLRPVPPRACRPQCFLGSFQTSVSTFSCWEASKVDHIPMSSAEVTGLEDESSCTTLDQSWRRASHGFCRWKSPWRRDLWPSSWQDGCNPSAYQVLYWLACQWRICCKCAMHASSVAKRLELRMPRPILRFSWNIYIYIYKVEIYKTNPLLGKLVTMINHLDKLPEALVGWFQRNGFQHCQLLLDGRERFLKIRFPTISAWQLVHFRQNSFWIWKLFSHWSNALIPQFHWG